MSAVVVGFLIYTVLFLLFLWYVLYVYVPNNTTEVDVHECPIIKEKDSGY